MFNLPYRIDLLCRLGKYLQSADPEWMAVKEKAGYENSWFTPTFIDNAVEQIATNFLQKSILDNWVAKYNIAATNDAPQKIGVVMAGNIPLVGFHDLLCIFISGHTACIKASTKDSTLIKHLVQKLIEWNPPIATRLTFADRLNNCDAYIATGSNNSGGYFDYYFGKYPHIIRRNKTSTAILTGGETTGELEKLADDVFLYFGLGCRSITKIYVPEGYDFIPLIEAFKKYNYLADHAKYKNNYDYNLAIQILNKQFYMSTEALVLVENKSSFSPICQLHYEFYKDEPPYETIRADADLQCVAGKGGVAFGQSQHPSIADYADGVDTLAFLQSL